ncbi:MAG: hypothetical protein BM564_01075 [Bacteroidetes bacterium MedPE-SWsnd-G2]|nr:MAG: hypothetical protein BM564_01075 [Bacteroidetes bacterium MedPE-SWsnd-G2]
MISTVKQLLSLFLIAVLFVQQSFAQNVSLDESMGAENAKQVEQQMGIYPNPELTKYITEVGNKLVSELEKPLFQYQFHLVYDSSPNAFALPGGYLYVTTGLLPILQNEAELACILGHEIIHSNNRHSVRQLKKSILPKLLEIPGNLIGIVNQDLGNLFNMPIATSNELLFASYGRKFETEADKEGILLAARAGYDPNYMTTALNRLSKSIEVASGNEEKKSYFSDHPYTPDRVKNIEKNISKYNWGPKPPITSDFFSKIDGAYFGDNPKTGFIEGSNYFNTNHEYSIQFPKNWILDKDIEGIKAFQPDQKAAMYMVIETEFTSATNAGQTLVSQLKPEYKAKLVDQGSYQTKYGQAYQLTFKATSEGKPVEAHLVWQPMNGKLFKILSFGYAGYIDTYKSTISSLGPLTSKQKTNLKIKQVKIVNARDNESLEALCKRYNCAFSTKLIATLNDLDPTKPLKEGISIKLIVNALYNQP